MLNIECPIACQITIFLRHPVQEIQEIRAIQEMRKVVQ